MLTRFYSRISLECLLNFLKRRWVTLKYHETFFVINLFFFLALKYEPTNVRYLWERSSLYEQMGDHKMAMDGYRRILNLLSPSDGERFMQLARDMAK